MFVTERLAGTVDVSVVIRIIDSADGTPETGVVFNTAGIDMEYRREGAASVDITEVTLAALTTAHTDGGFLHIGNGYYRLDLPDAACAAGSTGVLVHGTVTGMVVIGAYVQLVAYNPYDAVRLGLTALPNAAAEAAGGLYTRGTGAGQINQAANGMIDTNPVRLNNVSQSLLDLKDFADDGYDPATNKVQGVVLTDTVTTYTGNTPQTGDSFARLGAPAGASVSADIAAIEAQTDDIGVAGAGLTAIPDSAGVTTLLSRITSTLFTGITSLGQWLGLMAGKQVGNATARTEVRATGAGSGTYDETTDSQEAIRDNQAGAAPTVGAIADAVWDEVLAGHLAAGSTGEALNAAGSAGDPWTTALPGAYGAGTAGARVGGLTYTLPNVLDANVEAINADADGATNLDRSTRTMVLGTVGVGSTVTSIVTSSLDPTAIVTDQFKGRIVLFDKDTTTLALRGQGSDILSNTAGGVITCTALTTAPVSGDSFVIV